MKYRYRSYPLASEWYNVSEIVVVGDRWVTIEVTDEEGLVVVWEPYIDGYFLERVRIIEVDRKVTLRTTNRAIVVRIDKMVPVVSRASSPIDKVLPAVFRASSKVFRILKPYVMAYVISGDKKIVDLIKRRLYDLTI
jgi:hypothetical protein